MMIEKDTPKIEVIRLGNACNKCGHCCMMGAGFAQENELYPIAKFLDISIEKLKEKYFEKTKVFNKTIYKPKTIKKNKPYGRCIFLKEKECKIHDVKPLHCRVGNCSEHGESLSEWYTSNYLVDPKDPESIRQWALRVNLKPTIKGASPIEIVGDEKLLKDILDYKKMH